MSISIAEASRSRMRIAAGIVSEAAGGVAAVSHLVRGGGGRACAAPGVLWRGTKPGPPVMLVHGLGADSSCFEAMATALHRIGHTVYSVNYSCVGVDIATCGRQLAVEAARLRADTGAHRIHIVAHSLGGVVLRWAVANTRMGEWVGVAVTLGSPHQGSPLARLAPQGLPGFGTMISQLRPRLNEHAGSLGRRGGSVRWVAVAAQLDWVVPPRYALLPASDNVRNVILPGGGHLSLPADGRCLEIVRGELAAEAGDGHGDTDGQSHGHAHGHAHGHGHGHGDTDGQSHGHDHGHGHTDGDGHGTVVDLRTRPSSRTQPAGTPVAVRP